MSDTRIEAKLERGSRADPVILLVGVLIAIAGFLSAYDTDLWAGRDDLWLPMAVAGFSIVILNLVIRAVRPELVVDVLSETDGRLSIRLPRNVQFSGWVDDQHAEVDKSDVVGVRVADLRSRSTMGPVGMYWVCFELRSGRILESRFDDPDLVRRIGLFAEQVLTGAKLEIGDGIGRS